MGNVRFELNMKGLNELMKSSEMQSVLKSAGDSVARNAGSDYAAEVHTASYTAISNVYPNSKRAAHENFKDNTLLKSLQASGLRMSK